ncbi:hypothetical protein [Vibrio owensii]|uniref:hypothetical protein n=1 Tax=Vibrio owensii TaxID=696485 RepID=UPI0013CE5C6F|nr:hypothetical protein [Vibrio owensii]
MATAFYRNGVVTVTKGSKVVTGNHTTWTGGATKPLPGDVFVFNNKLYEVEVIVSDTELTLYREFEDDTQVDQEYVIMRNASLNISSRIAAAVAIAINQKQQQLDEFNNFLTNTTDPTVDFTDTLGNKVTVIPIPELEREIAELIDNTANIADLVQEAVDAKDGAVAAESNVTAMRDEVTQMKNDVTHMHDNVNTWQQEVSDNKDLAEQAAQATAQDKLATAQDVIDAGNSATAASESATAANTAKEASEAIQADVTSKHGDVEQWHTEVLAAKDSVDASETHVDEVKAEIDALKLDMDSTASEVSDIKDDIDAKYLQINSWHTETGELKDDAEAAAVKAEAAAQSVSDLEWKQYCQPQANMLANRLLVNNEFAASGMVHSGKHNLDAINEGLWVDISIPNKVFLGGGLNGTSETAHAVMNIAGALCEITTNWTFEDPSSNPDIANRVDMFGIELKELPVTDKVYPLGDLSVTPIDWGTANKKELVSNPYNNIFLMPDGSLIQLCWFARVVTGTRNGDWSNLWPSQGSLQYDNGVVFEGYSDTSNVGVFKHESEEQYFYVCGRVPRLNDAAYNNQNFMGSYKFNDEKFWYETGADSLTLEDAFLSVSTNKDTSGRTDGKRAQFIYPSGQGGIIDYRLPARDMGAPEDGAKVFQKVVNGTYRGEEKATWCTFAAANDVDGSSSTAIWFVTSEFPNGFSAFDVPIGSHVGGVRDDGTGYYVGRVIGHNNSVSLLMDKSVVRSSNKYLIVLNTDLPFSGGFTMMDVIGSPANIFAVPQLANGWPGRWIGVVPTDTTERYELTRKSLYAGTLPQQYTQNNGQFWVDSTYSLDATTNSRQHQGSAYVIVCPYTAFAKQMKESTNKAVFNARKGIGGVFSTSSNEMSTGGSLLEALLGKVGKSTTVRWSEDAVTRVHINSACLLESHGSYKPLHAPIGINQPSNDSPAVKALWYQTADNQQVSLNFAWNELVWKNVSPITVPDTLTSFAFSANSHYYIRIAGGTTLNRSVVHCSLAGNLKFADYIEDNDGIFRNLSGAERFRRVNALTMRWGDDSAIRIIDGTGTFINLNGDTCLYGASELAIPYGYTKNQARAGSQVPGVDL